MNLLIWGTTPLAAWLVARLHPHYPVTWLADDLTRADLENTGGINADGQIVTGIRLITHYEGQYDLILLATPSWGVVQTALDLRQALNWSQAPPPIVALQNGVGGIRRLESLFGEGIALAAAITRLFWFPILQENRPLRTHVLSSSEGGIALQADHPTAETAARLLREIGLSVVMGFAPSILWSSIFWGIQANAISAILDITPQEVYQNPIWFAYEHQQLIEALRVIRALNVRLMRLPSVNIPLMAQQARFMPRRIVAPLLSVHPRPPSLRDDLKTHSGRSDAAYFNGAIAVHGHDLKIPTPINHALALVLTDLAEGRMAWSQFKQNPDLLQAALRLAL